MLSRISALFTHLGHDAGTLVAATPAAEFSFGSKIMLSPREREMELVDLVRRGFEGDPREDFGEPLPGSYITMTNVSFFNSYAVSYDDIIIIPGTETGMST